MSDGAVVLATGMMTSVGIGARQTAAAVRAGISRWCETVVDDRRLQPIRMATVSEEYLPPLDPALQKDLNPVGRQARMVRLAAPALQEVMTGLPNRQQTSILLGMPELLPGHHQAVTRRFLQHLSIQSGLK